MFIEAFFVISKYPSIDEWINKVWYIHEMEYYMDRDQNNYTEQGKTDPPLPKINRTIFFYLYKILKNINQFIASENNQWLPG